MFNKETKRSEGTIRVTGFALIRYRMMRGMKKPSRYSPFGFEKSI